MSAGSAPILEIRGLSVGFGEVVAVDGVDLSIEEPGITALVGPSGCGKTSLLRAVAGFESPSAGTIRIAGSTVSGPGVWVAPERRRVGMVFQEGALFPHLTVGGNVLYGLKGRAGARERAREVLELVGMSDFVGRYPNELSGGQQQRVALARALAPSPDLVLLDEPFAGLDETLRERVREEVRGILHRAGATGVLVTHDQEEALSVADRVAVMESGRILQVGAPEEVYHHPASVQVARFIGDGQLVDCTVEDGTVRSVFGEALTNAPAGPGLLLVRPEDLVVMPGCYEHGLSGIVGNRRFFGHDLLVDIRLGEEGNGAKTVSVRLLSSFFHPIGEEVRLCLRHKDFQVFPVDEQAAEVGRARPRREVLAQAGG